MPLVNSPIDRRAPFSGPSDSPGRQHLEDLRRLSHPSTWRASFTYWAKRSTPVSFILFVWQTLAGWGWTLVLTPGTVFADPLGTAAALIVYPVVWTFLGLAVFVFWLASLVGGQGIIEWIGNEYANGYSMVNWPNPQIFGKDARRAIDEARSALEGDVPTTESQQADVADENPDFNALKTKRIFSLPLARSLLVMSALVYERSDRLVRQAADIAFRAEQQYVKGSDDYEKEMKRAQDTLTESEKIIKDKAAEWDLSYDGVSDLSSIGGPFASIFYTPFGSSKKPFIALVFKGTGPSNFSEFLVDATIARVGAGVFFGPGSGTVHQGFYTDLFMTNDRSSGGDGYGSVIRSLRHAAARMRREWPGADLRIPVWVAGHSLGSALASLCYARLLRSPQDLGPDLELRDCYSFGTPRLGDGDFATAFEQTLVTPLDRPNILWRVANSSDIVTKVPPGFADQESARTTLPSLSVLNYAYLGACVRLFPSFFPHKAPYYRVEQLGAFHEATHVEVVDVAPPSNGERNGGDWAGWRKRSARWRSVDESQGANPLRWIMSLLLPQPLYAHFPADYLQHLNNLETTFEQHAREREERRRREEDTSLSAKAKAWGKELRSDAERLGKEVIREARGLRHRKA
ncbi:hypothetical protein JCM11641_007633 [Rhodosporidiobolus odoratus]